MTNYEAFDVVPVEGDNNYRVKIAYADGTTQLSESKTVHEYFKK